MTHRPAQALVEFALALPVFLLLLLGLFDFARLLFTYVSVADGARELARAASIAPSSSLASINAFNNYTLLGGGANPATDHVVFTVVDATCVGSQRQGLSCAGGSTRSSTCSLPLQTSCALPSRQSASGGYIQADVVYTFQFNPFFQSLLWNPAIVTTTARATIE